MTSKDTLHGICRCGDWDFLHSPAGCSVCNLLGEPCTGYIECKKERKYPDLGMKLHGQGRYNRPLDKKTYAARFAQVFDLSICPNGGGCTEEPKWPI